MNKLKMLVTLLFTISALTACCEYKGPQFNSMEKWVSYNPNIYFVSLEHIEKNSSGLFVGNLNVGNDCIDVEVVFGYGNKIEFYSLNTENRKLLCGSYKFDNDTIMVTIDNNDILNSEVKTITFNKEIIEPTSDKYVMIWDKICTEKVNEAYNEFFEKFE